MQLRLIILNLFILVLCHFYKCDKNVSVRALVFTVASEPTDGYARYLRSARVYNIEVTTLGLGDPWKGGDMKGVGGGYKVNLLKNALKPYKDDDETVILFTDAYDVIFLSPLADIIERFKKSDAKILFGAESFCWPDETLKSEYPSLDTVGYRFLNSGLFMGYASAIYELLKTPIKNTDDDQLFYTQAYLNDDIREKLNIKLDHTAQIFQNLNGAINDCIIEFDPDLEEAFLYNVKHKVRPLIVHGNGPSKLNLNGFGNYLASAFVKGQCRICIEESFKLDEDKLPVVHMSLFIERPFPFLKEWFDKIYDLDYPKDNLHLFIHNNVPFHDETVQEFVKSRAKEYRTFRFVDFNDQFTETKARQLAVTQAKSKEVDYFFTVDAEAHLDLPHVLRDMIRLNRTVITPVLSRPNQVWSNFWGALSDKGYYARSTDYLDIVKHNTESIFNVPYINSVVLAKASALPYFNYEHSYFDPDMALCYHLREANIFMWATNVDHYGHLINNEEYDISKARPDFYEYFTNHMDWERRYIHPEYFGQLEPNAVFQQPCPDVYWFAIGTDAFCDDMIAIMENFGQWSDGTNSDNRLQGGYEAVPTRDIHMNQVGLERIWLKLLQDYIKPLQEAVFIGYFHDPPRSLMNFVVRYRPDEQPSLRPHHDSSTFTINIALNRKDIDYEGGGCRFLRYNCSVEDTKKGWMLMHPGRLTHFHEGLLVTKGTRYIMISFVDP